MDGFQRQTHHTYFVYGSNMHPDQISHRCGSPVALGTARVADHKLAFFGHTSVWDGGEEAAVPEAGEEVWGMLYRKDLCSDLVRPSDAQRDFIVTAARAQGLPEAYIDRLSGLDVTKPKYNVPKVGGSERWHAVLRCTGCDCASEPRRFRKMIVR